MLYRNSIGAAVLAAVFVTAIADVRAQDEMKYPDWSGQWLRTGGIQEASLADQAVGGAGNDARYSCFPVGMPRLMSVIFPMEFILSPKITYVLFENNMRVESTPTGVAGRAIPSRPLHAIQSANGSMRTEIAGSTFSKSRPVT
jgi:hypothetical protein